MNVTIETNHFHYDICYDKDGDGSKSKKRASHLILKR